MEESIREMCKDKIKETIVRHPPPPNNSLLDSFTRGWSKRKEEDWCESMKF